jgi:hypothetical protein
MPFQQRIAAIVSLQDQATAIQDQIEEGGDKAALSKRLQLITQAMDQLYLFDEQKGEGRMKIEVNKEINAVQRGEATPPPGMTQPEYITYLYGLLYE